MRPRRIDMTCHEFLGEPPVSLKNGRQDSLMLFQVEVDDFEFRRQHSKTVDPKSGVKDKV